MGKAQDLRAEATKLLKLASAIDKVGEVEGLTDGTVLTFTHYNPTALRDIHLAAIYSRGAWHVAGPYGLNAELSWDELLEVIGMENLHTVRLVTDCEQLFDL
jgi:hypothetical protein